MRILLFKVNIVLTVIISCIIVSNSIAIWKVPYPSKLTFYESVEIRALCYSWIWLAMLTMAFYRDYGWTFPCIIVAMMLAPAFAPLTPPNFVVDQYLQYYTRCGLFIGLTIGVFLEICRRLKKLIFRS